jgi:hypothetical protein
VNRWSVLSKECPLNVQKLGFAAILENLLTKYRDSLDELRLEYADGGIIQYGYPTCNDDDEHTDNSSEDNGERYQQLNASMDAGDDDDLDDWELPEPANSSISRSNVIVHDVDTHAANKANNDGKDDAIMKEKKSKKNKKEKEGRVGNNSSSDSRDDANKKHKKHKKHKSDKGQEATTNIEGSSQTPSSTKQKRRQESSQTEESSTEKKKHKKSKH